MTLLETLTSNLEAAETEFESYATPLIVETRALTAEETARIEELRTRRSTLSERIVQAEKDAALASEVVAARQRLGTAAVDVHVTKNPRMYGTGSPNSYVADFVRASNQMFPGHREALVRLDRWAIEVAGEMRDPNSEEGKRARRSVASVYREQQGGIANDAVARATAYTGTEVRAGMDTTSASGGSFVTPFYEPVAGYAPYRQFNRVFADACNKQPLPEYGMTIYMPQVTGPAGIAAQAGQNSGITETDPQAGYLSTSLVTNAGQVVISQQLIDRAGPNFAFDVMVFDQLHRDYDVALDAYALTQALANAGVVAFSDEVLTGTAAGNLYAKLGQAKAATVDAAGVALPATHAFLTPVNWEWYAVQMDTTGRPLVVPDYAGAFNAAVAGGGGAPVVDGNTGYKLAGLPVFEDGNIPAHAGNNQGIVAHMPEVWLFEGDLVNRTIPSTLAPTLSVILQSYAYSGVIVRYPLAVQALQGAGLPLVPVF